MEFDVGVFFGIVSRMVRSVVDISSHLLLEFYV